MADDHPTESDLFDCLDRHGQSYERLDTNDLSALLIAGTLTVTDPVRVHNSDHWTTIGRWFTPPETQSEPPPSIQASSPVWKRPAVAAKSAGNPQSLKAVIIVCTAIITTAILIAAALLRPTPPQPTLADPIRRSQLEEIVHMANRNVGTGSGWSDYTKFRPAVVALENFQTLNSTWLASRTNIQESLNEALFDFKRALDTIDGPQRRQEDYPLFKLYRERGMRPLIKAVNEL